MNQDQNMKMPNLEAQQKKINFTKIYPLYIFLS